MPLAEVLRQLDDEQLEYDSDEGTEGEAGLAQTGKGGIGERRLRRI